MPQRVNRNPLFDGVSIELFLSLKNGPCSEYFAHFAPIYEKLQAEAHPVGAFGTKSTRHPDQKSAFRNFSEPQQLSTTLGSFPNDLWTFQNVKNGVGSTFHYI